MRLPGNECVLRWSTQEVDVLDNIGQHSPGLHLGERRYKFYLKNLLSCWAVKENDRSIYQAEWLFEKKREKKKKRKEKEKKEEKGKVISAREIFRGLVCN